MEGTLVAKVTHFFPKISVAVLQLTDTLKVGDRIKFVKDNESFEQTVTSMQVDKESITEAKKGQDIGMKTDKPVRAGFDVYKI